MRIVMIERPSVAAPGDRYHGVCPHCQSELQFHQPDSELPDRLLAVCEDCHHWYLKQDAEDLTLLVNGEGIA